MATIDASQTVSLDDQVRLQFLTGLRRRWSTDIFQQLRAEYESAAGPNALEIPVGEATAIIEACPSYPWFGWLERGGQKLKWRVITAIVDRDWQRLGAQFSDPGAEDAQLDATLQLPDWYADWDIHCQPGGVWSDLSSALIYELGTKILHIGRNSKLELHRLFTKTAVEDRPYRRIVDLGCGFGKSTIPFKEIFPEAEVIGLDFSASCVILAAVRAKQAGMAVTFRQADATASGIADGSVGLVTATMVLHEMPVPVLRTLFAETARMLEPGGACRFLEFARTCDPFRDAVMDHHAVRNNEPFMPGLMDMDVERELAAVGLTGGRWVPFGERGEGPMASYPDRADWHFPWAVLIAEKPMPTAPTS